MSTKVVKPATPEIRERVFKVKQESRLTLPDFTGIPNPDDMVLKPTDLGFQCIFLHHHQPVARCDVIIEGYRVTRGNLALVGRVVSSVREEDGQLGAEAVVPLKMVIALSRLGDLQL